MKLLKTSRLFATIALLVLICVAGCRKEESIEQTDPKVAKSPAFKVTGSSLFPPNANMYGKSYAQWGVEWWKWVLNFDCANAPFFDPTGVLQSLNQSGTVYFLSGAFGITSTITIPAGKAIFFPTIAVINDYPCINDPGFHPAIGETLEHFLVEGAKSYFESNVATLDSVIIELDGYSFSNLTNYRATSSMFNFTGNPDLVNCLDPCVTGSLQQGVSDGYWYMLKPLSPGTHTLHIHYVFQGGASDDTYTIIVP